MQIFVVVLFTSVAKIIEEDVTFCNVIKLIPILCVLLEPWDLDSSMNFKLNYFDSNLSNETILSK